MSEGNVQDAKLIAHGGAEDCATLRAEGVAGLTRDEGLQRAVKIIKENSSLSDNLKLLAKEVEKTHGLYLIARTNFKLMNSKTGREVLAIEHGIENVESKVNEAKNKFLSAKEEERKSVLELKEEYLSWYEKEGPKGVLNNFFRNPFDDKTRALQDAYRFLSKLPDNDPQDPKISLK